MRVEDGPYGPETVAALKGTDKLSEVQKWASLPTPGTGDFWAGYAAARIEVRNLLAEK